MSVPEAQIGNPTESESPLDAARLTRRDISITPTAFVIETHDGGNFFGVMRALPGDELFRIIGEGKDARYRQMLGHIPNEDERILQNRNDVFTLCAGTVNLGTRNTPTVTMSPVFTLRAVMQRDGIQLAECTDFVCRNPDTSNPEQRSVMNTLREIAPEFADLSEEEIMGLGRFALLSPDGIRDRSTRSAIIAAQKALCVNAEMNGIRIQVAMMQDGLAHLLQRFGYRFTPVPNAQQNREDEDFQQEFRTGPYYFGDKEDLDNLIIQFAHLSREQLDKQTREEKTLILQEQIFSNPELLKLALNPEIVHEAARLYFISVGDWTDHEGIVHEGLRTQNNRFFAAAFNTNHQHYATMRAKAAAA